MEATGADIEAAQDALWSCDDVGSADDAIAFLLRKRAPAAVPAEGPSRSAPGPSGPSPPTPPPPVTPAEQPREQRGTRRVSIMATGGVALGGSGVSRTLLGSLDRTPVKAETLGGTAHRGQGSRDPPPAASMPTSAPRKSAAAADFFRGFSSSSDSDDDTAAAVARGPQEDVLVNLADESGSESEGGEEEVLRDLREPLTLRRPNGKRPMAEEQSPRPSGGAAAASSGLLNRGKRPKGHHCPEPSEDCSVIDLCADHGSHSPARASSREPESSQQVIEYIDLT